MSALAALLGAVAFTVRVVIERIGLAYFLPRAGTSRQLLRQGRALRERR